MDDLQEPMREESPVNLKHIKFRYGGCGDVPRNCQGILQLGGGGGYKIISFAPPPPPR